MLADLKKIWPAEVNMAGEISIEVSTEIPIGAGLGSSAAWGASLSTALLHTLNFIALGKSFEQEKEKEFVWAYTNFLE